MPEGCVCRRANQALGNRDCVTLERSGLIRMMPSLGEGVGKGRRRRRVTWARHGGFQASHLSLHAGREWELLARRLLEMGGRGRDMAGSGALICRCERSVAHQSACAGREADGAVRMRS